MVEDGMNPSLEWGSKKELYRDVRRCNACRSSASLASLFFMWLERLWRPSVFSYFFGPPLPFNIRPEHMLVHIARIPVPQALWSSHGGEEFVIHTTAFYHCGIMVVISYNITFRITHPDIPSLEVLSSAVQLDFPADAVNFKYQCLDDLCRPQPKAKDKTCGATSKSLGNNLGSGSLRCLWLFVCAADQLHHDDHWWSWSYCWHLAYQILSQFGWVATPSGEFQRGF